jgi:SRSO17 transposase
VEYGLKQSKNELGWADFRITDYVQIQKWWQVVMSVYLLVSLHSVSLNPQPNFPGDDKLSVVVKKFFMHPWWDEGTGWKNINPVIKN